MTKRSRWSLWLLIGSILLLAACDEVSNEAPSPAGSENDAVLSVPTRTLGPIVSFTPRFTATPIPSITFTPSNTPTPTRTTIPPTQTTTPSPTPTATVSGVIRSTENVNLREGPSTEYDIVLSVPPGTELGVLGIQTDARNREWYKVALVSDEGEIQYYWVFATLVETEFQDVVGLRVTPPPPPETTYTPTATPEPNRVEVLAYCQQRNVRPPRPTTNDNVYVEWSWFVARADLMDEHLGNANYEVRLDGDLLENWERYATDIKLEDGVWIVYWYYPVGTLDAGDHEIDFRLTWDDPVNDGYQQFGPGTANEVDTGNCNFTVVES